MAKKTEPKSISITKFQQKLCACLSTQPKEIINVTDALGRVLAADVRARDTLPHHDLSAIEGYAVILSDLNTLPCSLMQAGESRASNPFRDEIEPGTAVKVYAGAPLPIGTSAIIPIENIETSDRHIHINEFKNRDDYICHSGIDFTIEEIVLKEGQIITARDIGLSAAMKVSWLPVRRKPNIGILAIGDELAMPGDGQEETARIISSSSLVINAFIEACGANAVNLGILNDTAVSASNIQQLSHGLDLLFTTGGLSSASTNLLRNSIDEGKHSIIETDISLNTIEHVVFGSVGNTPLLALPGNPISSQICCALLMRPAIEKMLSRKDTFFKKAHATLDRNLDVNDLKMDYIFSKLAVNKDKRLVAHPASSYDRMLMSCLAQADCLVHVDPKRTKRGDIIEITRFPYSVTSG